ncbi:MAG: YgiT-type zinc finger protein [Clostridia bacterium]|nr:YgiT-type zinc finger protein [Clostridia bacterium]
MKCSKCRNILNEEKSNYIWREGSKTVIIENTPVLFCDNCIKQFYTEDVVKNINDIAENIKELPVKLSVIDYNELKSYISNKE